MTDWLRYMPDHVREDVRNWRRPVTPEEEQEAKEREALIRQALDTERCPLPECGGEIEHIGMHERDSSNDRHKCRKCGWQYSEMESWARLEPCA